MPSVGIQTDEPEPPPPLIIYLPTPPPPTTTTTTTPAQPEPEPNQLQQGRTHQLELEDVASWPPLPPYYFNAVGRAHGRLGFPSTSYKYAVNCHVLVEHSASDEVVGVGGALFGDSAVVVAALGFGMSSQSD